MPLGLIWEVRGLFGNALDVADMLTHKFLPPSIADILFPRSYGHGSSYVDVRSLGRPGIHGGDSSALQRQAAVLAPSAPRAHEFRWGDRSASLNDLY